MRRFVKPFSLVLVALTLAFGAAPDLYGQSTAFKRGDADGDGVVDMSDAIVTLRYLFLRGTKGTCDDALDTNDDGKIQLGDAIYSFTVITTDPNELVACLHDRMPVILDPKYYGFWLDPDNQEASMLEELLRPYPAVRMSAHPVRTLVNSPAADSPECIAPAT